MKQNYYTKQRHLPFGERRAMNALVVEESLPINDSQVHTCKFAEQFFQALVVALSHVVRAVESIRFLFAGCSMAYTNVIDISQWRLNQHRVCEVVPTWYAHCQVRKVPPI